MNKTIFAVKKKLKTGSANVTIHSLSRLEEESLATISKLPFSLRILLENLLRNYDGKSVTADHINALTRWKGQEGSREEIPFNPARVILQDFTGVPAVVDLAAMRSAIQVMGGDPGRINPLIPVDLVIDHSVQVDRFGSAGALNYNSEMEFKRNMERYRFLCWGEKSFENFRVIPPKTGIVHQVNLEYLASVVMTKNIDGQLHAFPDTLVGTDSHTTMINGLGILGWGVGGIEAEAVMLGQPYYMILPDVVGVALKGELQEGVTATDLVLFITELLRKKGVVGKFVEFFGEGLGQLPLADRATIANMAPEYGATMGYFPVDDESLRYLRTSGRPEEQIDLVDRYMKEQQLFRTSSSPDPEYSDIVEFDLSCVVPSLAGPKRPQDRVDVRNMKAAFRSALVQGFGRLTQESISTKIDNEITDVSDGSVVIAAITSCTNTSNPSVMIGAGLLAKKAALLGLRVRPFVKTSLAPGSKVVTDYLVDAGLMESLEKIGFNVVGYGCTTCIGNSGPLPEEVAKVVTEHELVVASVLSGNRNFEGRINPLVKANYLASPMLVIAYALAGRVDIDLYSEPIGRDNFGRKVFLKEIWPSLQEINKIIEETVRAEIFRNQYDHVFDGNEEWNNIDVGEGRLYSWDRDSTYIREPVFFNAMPVQAPPAPEIRDARVLALLGDSVTTDHISPAGAIPAESPAEKYLMEYGVKRIDFNSYGSRRGNHEVMVRGTFGNIRLKNHLARGKEGGYTAYLPGGDVMSIYDASVRYGEEGIPLIVIAGKEYGTGSSRDWAAKGTALLGVKAVLAESFERIHRSNLVGMGVLPLQFREGESWESLGLTGEEVYSLEGLTGEIRPGQEIMVKAKDVKGDQKTFRVLIRLDSPVDIEYYLNGGILQTVLRKILRGGDL